MMENNRLNIWKPVTVTLLITGWHVHTLKLTFANFETACAYVYSQMNRYGNVKWILTAQA